METNEDNFSENQKYYNYPIKNFLTKEANSTFNAEIMLCIYTINTSCKYPFIQYLLSDTAFGTLSLPALPVFSSVGKDNLVAYSKVFLSGILQVVNFEEFNKQIVFDGFYEYEEKLYLFFDITKFEFCVDDMSSLRFALIDEIVNHYCVCDMNISPETTNFFINNNSLNYLYDPKNEAYEVPIVGFVSKEKQEKINFVLIFGESAKNKSAILGPYYYFTDFNNAVRQNSRIVRFALFTGKTKYIDNMPNNSVDESEIKKQRLNDTSLNKNYEIQTLRISDHDGIWASSYDSAYLGNIELDDGSFVDDTPMIVLKEYKQQIPLSSHYIDKNKLKQPNSNNYGYSLEY